MENLILKFKVKQQNISRMDLIKVVSGSRNYVKASFEFSEEWNKIVKTARFATSEAVYDVLLDAENQCMIPWEVIDESGYFDVSAFGGDLITVDKSRVYVIESAYTGSGAPADPTPSVYEQIITKLAEIEAEVDPEAIRSEVEAILAEKNVVTESTVNEIVNRVINSKNFVTQDQITGFVDETEAATIAESTFDSHKSEFVTPSQLEEAIGGALNGTY